MFNLLLELLGNSCLLIIASQDHYDHEFSWIFLLGVFPLLCLRHNWSSWPADLLIITVFCFFYASKKLGNGDCDLMILMVAILGTPGSCLAIMVACLLDACHPNLYHQQEIAFCPCLGLALSGALALQFL